LKNLKFIFDTENLLDILALSLQEEPCLIVIDAFMMHCLKINANTQVRQFFKMNMISLKVITVWLLFLHHIGKNTQKNTPSKDSIIGSQAFEAKMRCNWTRPKCSQREF
jgi:RecA-family ATPase